MSRYLVMPSPAQLGTQHVTSGLVGYWDAGNSASYAGSGTTLTDLAGSSNGTLINSPPFTRTNGGGFQFAGTNEHIQANNVAAFAIGTTCTHECVIHWDGANLTSSAVGKWGGSPWAEYSIGMWPWNGTDRAGTDLNYIVATFYLGSSAPVVYLTYKPPGPGIYYVQAVHNTTAYKMWVNGVLRDSKTYAATPTGTFNTNAYYGIGRAQGSTAYWRGRIHLARLYNRVLSDAEIEQNFNAFRGRFGL